jgi:hypothetical protein
MVGYTFNCSIIQVVKCSCCIVHYAITSHLFKLFLRSVIELLVELRVYDDDALFCFTCNAEKSALPSAIA